DRPALVVPEWHAHQCTDPGTLGAAAGGEPDVGPDVQAEDRLAVTQDVIEDRPADDQLARIVVADPVRPGDERNILVVFQKHEAAPGLREHPKESCQYRVQNLLQLTGSGELLTDFEQGTELDLGPAAGELAPGGCRGFDDAEDRRAAVILITDLED